MFTVGVGVSQVVEPDAGEIAAADESLERRGEALRMGRRAIGASECEVVVLVAGAERQSLLSLFAAPRLERTDDIVVHVDRAQPVVGLEPDVGQGGIGGRETGRSAQGTAH